MVDTEFSRELSEEQRAVLKPIVGTRKLDRLLGGERIRINARIDIQVRPTESGDVWQVIAVRHSSDRSVYIVSNASLFDLLLAIFTVPALLQTSLQTDSCGTVFWAELLGNR